MNVFRNGLLSRCTGIAVALLGAAFCAYAQEPVQVLKIDRFSELFRDVVGVTGRGVRGIALLNQATTVTPEQLSVVLPAGPVTRLCVVTESQDARYYAELEYTLIPRTTEQRVLISFPTKYGHIIQGYKTRDFGVSARLTSNCNNTSGNYLPIIWGNSSAQGKFILLISAGAPNIEVRVFDRNKHTYSTCTKDRISPQLIAFDTECVVNAGVKRGQVEWVIVRERYGDTLDDQVIATYIP